MTGPTDTESAVLRDWIARYRYDTPAFVREVLRAEPEAWQLRVLEAYDADRRASPDRYLIQISIASGHGVGKTALLSWIIIHHATTLYPQKTAVTAPSAPQLWDALWPEIGKWIAKMPRQFSDPDRGLFVKKAERVVLRASPDASFISAKAARADQPEALQGVHEEHVLLVLDEFSGVPDAVIEAASGSLSGPRVVMIGAGNPLRGQGYFYETHHRLKDRWHTFTVSIFESKYASKDYAEDVEARFGKDSNAYRTRVLGQFPTTDDDAVIPRDLIEAAVGRDVVAPKESTVVWGLDVAAMGQHRTVLAKRRANVVPEPPKVWGGLDDAQVAGRIKAEWDVTPAEDRPSDINIDAIGYGAAVVTRLKDLGLPANGINVSENPSLEDSGLRNLRAELWFKGRSWFQRRDSRLPERDKDHRIDDLIDELATVTFKPQPISGKIVIAEKKGRRSPDLADAFLLTLATESVILQGNRPSRFGKRPAIDFQLPGLV